MNDIEKAINYWKQFKKEIKKLREIKPGAEWDEQEKATDLAISALEKQICKPIKVTKPSPSMTYVTCLSCGKFLDDRAKDNYCYRCGQKLDWSVEQRD